MRPAREPRIPWVHPPRAAALVLLAVLALLPAPAVARADGHRLTQQQVISIASSDPAVAPIERRHPGAHWEVVYDQLRGTWSAALEVKGEHTVLADFTIRDPNRPIAPRHIVSTLGPPRLTSDQAVQLARR